MSIQLLLPLFAGATSILIAILGVGFLIFIHELGHYLACRLTKTRTETFSIGFGPRLFGWESMPGQPRRFTVGRRRLDPTEHAMDFRVAAIPLGGYVKMVGENPGDERAGSPDEFAEKPIMARVFIVSAGVIMNVIAGFALYLVAFANNVDQPPAVAGLVSPGGPAWQAGVQDGDRFLELNGKRLRSFTELKMESVFLEPGEPARAVIERGGERLSRQITPRYDEEMGIVQIQVAPGYGLKLGNGEEAIEVGATDEIEVGGVLVRGGFAAMSLIESALNVHPDQPVDVRVPGGRSLQLTFVPGGKATETIHKIGVEPYGPPVIEKVRGDAKELLRPGDELVAAETPAGRLELHRASAMLQLTHRSPIDALVVRRDGQTKRIEVGLRSAAQAYAFLRDVHVKRATKPVVAPLPAGVITLVGDVPGRYPSSPAADAGLMPGDRVLSVGDVKVESWTDIIKVVQTLAGDSPLELALQAPDGEERKISLQPVALEAMQAGHVALFRAQEPFETDGIMDAAGVALKRTGAEITNIFRMIGAFFTGRISFQQNVAGPATIVTVSAGAAEQSMLTFFLFLAYISITLAVLNILPIPVLDGGWLMFILIEKIKGSPLKPETIGRLQFVGMMMLLVLMFFAFRNDFINLTQ